LRDKRHQMRAAPTGAIRLIVLCDGDCAAMRESVFHATGSNYSAKQIATEFLRKTSSVDLVLLVAVEKRNPHDLLLRDYRMSYDLAAAPPQTRRPGLDDDVIEAVRVLLERAVQAIPKPMADACNAARRCEKGGYGLGKHGGYQRSGNMIRISARLVQELLAGEVTPERFAEFHGWGAEPDDDSNPFAQRLGRGELISAINVIDCGDEDDNQLEFHFSEADPAVSRFRRVRAAGTTPRGRGKN
jgi:hypothetical protein